MLKVPTYISHSKIQNAGAGLFTKVPIKTGQLVCDKRTGTYEVYPDREVEQLSSDFSSFIRNFAYHVGSEWRLDKDNEKFINHSRRPNLDSSGRAIKDIKAGEELLYDYRDIDDTIAMNPPSWL